MFGWFGPKCPVGPGVKRWTEMRMNWLAGQFGWDRLRNGRMILPTPEYFPDPFDGSEEAVQRLFDHTCGYMDVDPSRVEMRLRKPERASRFNPVLDKPRPDWVGLYDAQQEKTTVWIETASLDDPESLVATFAHELAHLHLLGGRRMAEEEEDMEFVTDLATVYFGLGIFGANTAFREKSYRSATEYHWSVSYQGYLTYPMWGYALALFAWHRQETKPAWLQHLQSTVRAPCRDGIAWLPKNGDTVATETETADGTRPMALLYADFPPLEQAAGDEQAEPADDGAPEEPHEHAGDSFTCGVFHAQHGQWQEAVQLFSAAIEANPRDAEAYQQRALAYLELELKQEALADAQRAVRLEPEDSEGYRIRGTASMYAGEFDVAIADLSRYLDEEDDNSNAGLRPSRAFYFRGLAYVGKNDLQRALSDFTTAIRRWPDWPEPYEARADVYDALAMPEKAAADRAVAARRDLGAP